MRFGKGASYSFRMMQKRSEILQLVQRVAELRPKVIVELGTAQGGTLFVWTQIASELVVSCDLRHESRQAAVFRQFPPPGSSCKVELVTGDTHTAPFQDQLKAKLGGRPVDFLFVDGDHTREGVARDFADYGPLVRSGGIIAFHDIVHRQAIETNQVGAFWDELKRHANGWEELVDQLDQVGFGIGLLRVSSPPSPGAAEG